MASVSTLSICFFSYFIFIPVVYFSQLFVLKLVKWDNPLRFTGSPKLFDFQKNEVFFLIGVGLSLLVFAKALRSQIPFIQFFIYFNVAIFLVFLLIFTFFSAKKSSQFELDTILTVSIWLLFSVSSFTFCSNFIIMMFNIELISTIYFFFFLFYMSQDSLTVIKFKNMLSNYLFISFFTTCGLTVSLFLITYYCGTTDFGELNATAKTIPSFVWNILLISLFTKLGGPGTFFFKIEIYKVLTIYSVVFFSISSFLINTVILLFLFKTCISFYTFNSFIILVGVLLSNLLVLSRGFQLVSFCQFLGLSAVNTWGLLMIFFLVNDSKFCVFAVLYWIISG